jgi:hypothetical protein
VSSNLSSALSDYDDNSTTCLRTLDDSPTTRFVLDDDNSTTWPRYDDNGVSLGRRIVVARSWVDVVQNLRDGR